MRFARAGTSLPTVSRPRLGQSIVPYPKAVGLLQRRERVACRLVAGLTVVLAVGLTVKTTPLPRQLRVPDSWAYAFATQNFARGKWIVTDEEMAAGRMRARLQGGHLTQYVNVGPNRWALEKAPGFPLLAVPFSLAHGLTGCYRGASETVIVLFMPI